MADAPRAEPLTELLRGSFRMLVAHPLTLSALGGAVLLSLASTLFGIGVLVGPWFVLEIFAFQLSVLGARVLPRSIAWARAGLVVVLIVGVVATATWVAALAIGPDVSTADLAARPLPWLDAVERVLAITSVTAIAVAFIAPFVYAPLVLLERGGTIGAAVLESAWLVQRGGMLRHWVLAFLAHLLPFVPVLVFAIVAARTLERAATPLGILLGLPLVPFSIPLGQGLLTASYAAQKGELADPRWTRAESRPPRALVIVLAGVVLAPILSVVLVVLGTLREAPVTRVSGPPEPAAERDIELGEPTIVRLEGSTVELEIDDERVTVRAGDGTESALPHRWRGPVEHVWVRRRGEHYVVTFRAAGAYWLTKVDRAGVRLDDTIANRLSARFPSWGLIAIPLSFALSGLLLVGALAPLGVVRRRMGAPRTERPPAEELGALQQAALTRAWRVGWLLVPFAAVALAAGAIGLFGG
ncbi:MAG: hypothetical protein AB7S26_24140 [Sandaracinaceae bacterium]